MTDYKDHHKDKKKNVIRAHRKHLNLFYLLSLAVIILVMPLIVLQVQERTVLRQEAAPSCSSRTEASCGNTECKLVSSLTEGVCKGVVGSTKPCSTYNRSGCSANSTVCTWYPKKVCVSNPNFSPSKKGPGSSCTTGAVCISGKCIDNICKNDNGGSCTTGKVCVSGYCGSDNKCAAASAPNSDEQYHGKVSCDNGRGTCFIRSRLSGTVPSYWHTGKCPGSPAVQCYSDRPATNNPPPVNNPPVNDSPKTNPPPAGDDTRCTSQGGQCQLGQANNVGGPCTVNGKAGTVKINLCSGGNDRRCCVPNGSNPTNPNNPIQPNPNNPSNKIDMPDYCKVGNCSNEERTIIGIPNAKDACGSIARSCCRPARSSRTSTTCELAPPKTDPNNPNQPVVNPVNPVTSKLGLSIKLQGIGPDGNSNPQSQQIPIVLRLYKDNVTAQNITASNNVLAAASIVVESTASYDSASGYFVNDDFDMGEVPEGNYKIIVQNPKFLDVKLTNSTTGTDVFNIQSGQKIIASTVSMRGGDVQPEPRGNNYVDLFDYNAVIGCTSGQPESACLNKKLADINDDGVVDQEDLDIVRSNFGQEGIAFDTGEFVCKSDPECTASGSKNALQLCRLLCTKKPDRL